MMKVGLTGGIGSGKSTIAGVFSTLGIPVFFADQEARNILETDTVVQAGVRQLLGNRAFDMHGNPDRAFIADLVFSNDELLRGLNNLIHPAVRENFDQWCETQSVEVPYVIQEAAILFESGGASLMDANIVVWAPEEIRIARVVERDKVQPSDVSSRIQNQMPDTEQAKRADYIIVNDNDHPLIRQVMDIHRVLLFRTNPEANES